MVVRMKGAKVQTGTVIAYHTPHPQVPPTLPHHKDRQHLHAEKSDEEADEEHGSKIFRFVFCF